MYGTLVIESIKEIVWPLMRDRLKDGKRYVRGNLHGQADGL